MGQDFAGFENHQAIPKEVWVVIQYISGNRWVVAHSTCLVDAWELSDKPEIQYIHSGILHPGHRPPKMWAQV